MAHNEITNKKETTVASKNIKIRMKLEDSEEDLQVIKDTKKKHSLGIESAREQKKAYKADGQQGDMRAIIVIALIVALYASVVSTYLLVDNYFQSESERITKECEEQDLMSEFDCYQQY
jgi:hypothetical protein